MQCNPSLLRFLTTMIRLLSHAMRKHSGTLILLMVAASIVGCTTSQKGVYTDAPKPAALAEQRSQGTAMLRIQVAEDGTLTDIKIEQSTGFSALDQKITAWVQENWHWPPGKVGSYRVPIKFKVQ